MSESRIVSDPEICSGKPVIRGTRVLVRNLESELQAGTSVERILASYPSLIPEDIRAVIDAASRRRTR